MNEITMAGALIFLMPPTVLGCIWLPLYQRYGRPEPRRVRRNDVVIIRKR